MEQAELNRLTNWLFVLQDVQKAFRDNTNIDTIIATIKSRINNHNKE